MAAPRISAGRERVEDGHEPPHFLKIMSASFALAGVATLGAGCRRPEEKLEPFGKQPEDYVYGEPQYFATAMPTRTGAIPLVVKSYEGRPVKIEGNALLSRQQRRHRPLRAGFDSGSLRSRPRAAFQARWQRWFRAKRR